jgi:hypothetical protein
LDSAERISRLTSERGGIPRDLRNAIRQASDAVNAYARGTCTAAVALNYGYDPITAMVFVVNCCAMYGAHQVEVFVPAHIFSLVEALYPHIQHRGDHRRKCSSQQ